MLVEALVIAVENLVSEGVFWITAVNLWSDALLVQVCKFMVTV